MSPCHVFGKVTEGKKLAITGEEILLKALSSLGTASCSVFTATKVCNQSGSSFVQAPEGGPGQELSLFSHV